MIGRDEQLKMIEAAKAEFPETFELRVFPGDTFRISSAHSYVNDSGVLMLYTEVLRSGKWLSFAKGSVRELRAEVVASTPKLAITQRMLDSVELPIESVKTSEDINNIAFLELSGGLWAVHLVESGYTGCRRFQTFDAAHSFAVGLA